MFHDYVAQVRFTNTFHEYKIRVGLSPCAGHVKK